MKNTYTNFEDYLKSKHAEGYMGTDDDMHDNFVSWSDDLDFEEFLDYSDEYAEIKSKERYDVAIQQFHNLINSL